MKDKAYKIFPLGIDALTIEFGNRISVDLNDRVVNLAGYFEDNKFPGLIEIVPAYASLTIFYDVRRVRRNSDEAAGAFQIIKNLAERAIENIGLSVPSKTSVIEIAVDFSPEFAPDLDFVAAPHHLTHQQVIELFTARTYRVFMLGFMPGFAYMGEVDERIAAARKTSPRLKVPQGSVGIAGRQTGIYPFDSPGGWQIIGRTDFELFTPEKRRPCALAAGDLVRFYALNG